MGESGACYNCSGSNQSDVESQIPLLSLRGIRKSFSGVPALTDGCLELDRGEIHALCGGNGAGKSTLLKILMGFLQPDAGEIRIDGAPVHFSGPKDALARGIAIVQQELSSIPDLTVAENIFLGAEPRRFGFVDFARLNREAAELLRTAGCDTAPTAKVRHLSVASRQLVEIAKALSHRGASILILDEPTSALGEPDVARLFETVRGLAGAGKGIIFVTHRLGEVFEIAHRYTVLKDGATVASGEVAGCTPEQLVEQMVGMPVEREFVARGKPGSGAVLEVSGLNRPPHFEDVGFTVQAGEVLGIYGRSGSGRTEILDAIYGITRPASGRVSVAGRVLRGEGPAESLGAGLAYVTEDRKRNGLVLGASTGDNLSMSILPRLGRWGFIDGRRRDGFIHAAIARMRIHPPDPRPPVRCLSGGNQQKVVLGRSVACDPKVLLLDEPTRGVDIAAKTQIYGFIAEFTAAGGGVLLVSSDLDEILGLSDRILVLRGGRIASTFSSQGATQRSLVLAAD
jgi:putative xylitol transport system ATP-binding protein